MAELRHILYAEDEPDIRTLGQMALERVGGFTVVVAADGAAAIAAVADFTPDLILLDMMMPTMDGIEAFQRFRQMPQLDHVPIVFLTAKVQPSERQNYLNLGADDVIAKPFDVMSLPAQLRAIWQRRQG